MAPPTIRKRLFLIARRDGRPITFPAPTHAKDGAGGLSPWRAAAECIDWSLPCPSIFLTKDQARAIGVKRPLAPATMQRIARGVIRYVIEDAAPFIVPITHQGDARVHAIDEPLRTITTANRGEHALIAPLMTPRYGERDGQEPRAIDIRKPAPTVVPTGNGAMLVAPHLMTMRNAQKPFNGAGEPAHTITAEGAHINLVSAFLAQHSAGSKPARPARAPSEPVSTITANPQQGVVAAHLINLKGADRRAVDVRAPSPAICAEGSHVAEVRAFLMKYYGAAQPPGAPRLPLGTVTGLPRFALVTIEGVDYEIVDIGLRMLTPRELFRAQGFREDYIIDRRPDGSRLPKSAQTRHVGNSVSPPPHAALIAANLDPFPDAERRAA